MFGGVYVWSAGVLSVALGGVALLAGGAHPRFSVNGAFRTLDLSLVVLVAAVAVQLLPLPVALVRLLSPARDGFLAAVALEPTSASFVPLTLDRSGTAHALLSLSCAIATFWIAREVFSHGGIRTFSTILAWGAVAIALIAVIQHAAGTGLIYGFWRPRDTGARPLGPFVNRNHLGTWSILAICVCAGYLQWRIARDRAGLSWRSRLSRWLDGGRLVPQLAVVLLACVIALGASRSALLALGCAAGYVALSAPAAPSGGRRRLSMGVLAAVAIVGMLGYGDRERLLMRIDETRTTGMANRVAIWRDTITVLGDFPLAGVGAGAFATAMRVYQTTPRTYYHNEAHNQYLQVAAEGGVLVAAPALASIVAFAMLAWRQLRRRGDPVRWMRVAATGGLIGVAVQSVWETGLTLPANGMFAAALAGLIVHSPAARPTSSAAIPPGAAGEGR